MRRPAWWLGGLASAVLIVVLLAPLASTDPDGLERVAQDTGFIEAAAGKVYEFLPDYSIPGIADGPASTILAGIVGVAIVFSLVWALGVLLKRRPDGPDRAGR